MTTDLRIALAHGGTFLVAAGFQYGIFAVLVLDAKHGLLEIFLLFQLLGVGLSAITSATLVVSY